MIPEEFFDRSVNSLIDEIVKLREYSIEDAQVFIEDDIVFVVFNGALFTAKNGDRFNCIGDSEVGFPITVPEYLAKATYRSKPKPMPF